MGLGEFAKKLIIPQYADLALKLNEIQSRLNTEYCGIYDE